ncbi:MAG: GDP-mannose 4,6-dehydratase [Novosphingobium sp.]|jgi:dTDP-glucose 4,6-dehydratase|uniref:GDP-mannose 4,6-dehydratase n=1 Tax=Novosphingobium sp. TaxID=1874826 RepID=UPI0022C98DE5|nr:GDP-mannose 4,6-dehydratase [Novosphingobium sp.]MCZ8035988.1 GDP-mannose 4,6-dehydratase [Novosphingobium sp.]
MQAIFADVRPDIVMHLAAESHVDHSIDGPGAFIQTNIVSSFTLLQEALRHWGGLDDEGPARFPLTPYLDRRGFWLARRRGLFPRRHGYQPNSPYSTSKGASDHLIRAWRHMGCRR